MVGGLVRLILLRVLGARVLLAITAFGWLRRKLAGRRDQRAATAVTGVDRRRPATSADHDLPVGG